MKLNGKELVMPGNTFPTLDPVDIQANTPIYAAPLTISFISFPSLQC